MEGDGIPGFVAGEVGLLRSAQLSSSARRHSLHHCLLLLFDPHAMLRGSTPSSRYTVAALK